MKIVGGEGLGGLLAALGASEREPDEIIENVKREFQREGDGYYTPDIVARQALDFFAEWQKEYDFKPGDLVQVKAGSGSKFPNRDRPGVFIERLSEPVYDGEQDSGSPSFRKPLNVRVGCVVGGRFQIYHYGSHELEPYSGPVA